MRNWLLCGILTTGQPMATRSKIALEGSPVCANTFSFEFSIWLISFMLFIMLLKGCNAYFNFFIFCFAVKLIRLNSISSAMAINEKYYVPLSSLNSNIADDVLSVHCLVLFIVKLHVSEILILLNSKKSSSRCWRSTVSIKKSDSSISLHGLVFHLFSSVLEVVHCYRPHFYFWKCEENSFSCTLYKYTIQTVLPSFNLKSIMYWKVVMSLKMARTQEGFLNCF